MEIPHSTFKLAKMLVICLLFVAGGLWLLITNPQTSNSLLNNSVVKIFAGIVCIAMGTGGVWLFSRTLLDKRPGLVVNQEGIHINTGLQQFGFIPWADVTHIYETSIQGSLFSKQKLVSVGLTNPQKYISRVQEGSLQHKLMSANSNRTGSYINIAVNNLAISHKDLLKLLSDSLQQYKGQQAAPNV